MDTVKSNGQAYNFPIRSYNKLDIYSVVQNLDNSYIDCIMQGKGSYDKEEFTFDHPDVFKDVYKDLTSYDNTFNCLEGMKMSELDNIGKTGPASKDDSDSKKNDSNDSDKKDISDSKDNGSDSDSSSWVNEKTDQLVSFMDSWSQEIDQSYTVVTNDTPIKALGNRSINDFVDGSVTPEVNGSPVKFGYNSSVQYRVMIAYDGETNNRTKTAYVFTMRPNGPVALVAQGDNSGDSVSFKPTENKKLQDGFANIMN